MTIPTIAGLIRRRLLINYRIEPAAVRTILPPNFRPKLHCGYAVAGICLIRLEEIRPVGMPPAIGLSSENSAHRIAVEWCEGKVSREGVFVWRRDTGSRLNALAGGRLFPGVHHRSQFAVRDADGQISIRIESGGKAPPLVDLRVRETGAFPEASIFHSVDESSRFFENGSVGYSSRPNSHILDGLRLEVKDWAVCPLAIDTVRSAYFDDRSRFPADSIQLDHALLMRDIFHRWHSEPPIRVEA